MHRFLTVASLATRSRTPGRVLRPEKRSRRNEPRSSVRTRTQNERKSMLTTGGRAAGTLGTETERRESTSHRRRRGCCLRTSLLDPARSARRSGRTVHTSYRRLLASAERARAPHYRLIAPRFSRHECQPDPVAHGRRTTRLADDILPVREPARGTPETAEAERLAGAARAYREYSIRIVRRLGSLGCSIDTSEPTSDDPRLVSDFRSLVTILHGTYSNVRLCFHFVYSVLFICVSICFILMCLIKYVLCI